ncbi:hypothetical protein [Paraburkholderia sp. EG304]|uniref:hypothetical protein n=1 Tax=Paraburkholderia sp. EG304 TaxID=3237015 RepID=UPI003979DD00
MRFLDYVDRRDGAGAASLLHPEVVWETASPFGPIRGISDPTKLIESQLAPRKFGPGYVRHRMEFPTDAHDLTVETPTGERCRFCIDVETVIEGGQPRTLISKLVREPV